MSCRALVVVGAPNDTQYIPVPSVVRPGAVYSCEATFGANVSAKCDQLPIDTKGELEHHGRAVAFRLFFLLLFLRMSEETHQTFF